MRLLAASLVATGCAAPPLGIGRGALVGSGSTAFGLSAAALEPAREQPRAIARSEQVSPPEVAPTRSSWQLDGSHTFRRSERYSFDVGGALTYFRDTRTGIAGLGLLPYWRPRWQLGHVSLAIAVSGVLLSGGEAGLAGAFSDAQLGYGDRTWSVYAGGYGHSYLVADGGPLVLATQVRAGAEYMLELGTTRAGLAVEAYRQLDAIWVVAGGTPPVTSNLRGLALKLRVELP